MRLLHICAFTVAAVLGAAAPAQSLDTAFTSFSASLNRLERSPHQPSQPQAEGVAALRARIERLRASAGSIPPADRAAYALSLSAQADLLDEAERDPNKRALEAVIGATAQDLDVKLRTGPGLGATNIVYGHVNVTVRTLRDNREVGGLVVSATPVALANREPLFRFDRLSSPTSKPLPPGRYEFSVQSGARVVARERADVGLSSSRTVNLDLVVPPGV